MTRSVALLVDDDRATRAETIALLWRAGFLTMRALELDSFATLLGRDEVPTVALVAAEFDGGKGGDCLAEMSRRPRWRDVPVIVLTRSPQALFAEALQRMGTPVLEKPIADEPLRAALCAVERPPQPPSAELARSADLVLSVAAQCRIADMLMRQVRRQMSMARYIRRPILR